MKILAVAVIVLVLTILISDYAVYASHYRNLRWSGYTVNYCYDTYGLSYLKIDGYANRVTTAISEINIARNDWNNQPSRFTLNVINPQYCQNWIYAANISSAEEGSAAVALLCVNNINNCSTDLLYLPSSGTVVKASITFNTTKDWRTDVVCDTQGLKKFTLNYVARHEFGHWVVFDHYFTYPGNTVMYPSYNCESRNSVKPIDSNELSQIYG
jgi:hypothetical protein